jgi:transposase InsO family protein
MFNNVHIVNDELWVTKNLLIDHGISENYIKKSLCLYRKGTIKTWNNIEYLQDRRVKLIQLSFIPYTTRYKLPDKQELIDQYNFQKTALKQQQKNNISNTRVQTCYQGLVRAIKNHQFTHEFSDILNNDIDKAIVASKNFAVLQECITLLSKGYRLEDVFRAYTQLVDNDIKKIKGNSTTLKRRINDVSTHDLYGVLDKRVGKTSQTIKFNDELKIIAEKTYSESMITYNHVKIIMDDYCFNNGLEPISLSSIKRYLGTPKIKNRIFPIKYGRKYFENHDKPFVTRKKPSYAGSKWVIDGTAIQFIAKDEHGKQIRLDFFVVYDVHSGKVVGYDFSRSETSLTVQRAIEIAVKNTGYLPREIVADNSAAIKSKESKRMFDRLEKRGVIIRYAKVGNAKDKEIEQFFRTSHSYFRTVAGWIGGNITSVSKEYRPPKELLSKAYKLNGVPNEDTLKSLTIELIDQYNCDELNNRVSPAKKHEISENPNPIRLSAEDTYYLFWNERQTTVKNGMVLRIIGNTKYYYLVYSHDDKLKLNGQKVLMKMDNNNLDEIHLFTVKNENFICSCRLRKQPNLAKAEQTKEDELEIIKQIKHNESYDDHMSKITQGRIDRFKEITGKEEIVYTDVFTLRKESIKNNELSETLKYYDHFGIDPTKINRKVGKPVKSDQWERKKLKKDYTINPYKGKGDLSIIKSEV